MGTKTLAVAVALCLTACSAAGRSTPAAFSPAQLCTAIVHDLAVRLPSSPAGKAAGLRKEAQTIQRLEARTGHPQISRDIASFDRSFMNDRQGSPAENFAVYVASHKLFGALGCTNIGA